MTVAEYEKRQRKIRSSSEIRYTRIAVAAITQSMAKVIAAIDSRNINGLENRVDALIDEQPITDLIMDIYVKFGAKIALDFVTIQPIRKKAIFDWEQFITDSFKAKAAEKVTEIVGTTRDLAKKVIKKSLLLANEGKSIDDIANNMRKSLKESGGPISTGRARMIARTEVIGAVNNSTHEAAASLGLDLEHKWIVGGKNVRSTHYAAQSEGWKPMSEGWQMSGVTMMHPHDTAGPAKEVINCKCVEIFRVKQ